MPTRMGPTSMEHRSETSIIDAHGHTLDLAFKSGRHLHQSLDVEQEFYGLLLAHFALRGLMHEAALKAHVDPDTLSFVHSLRVVRRKLPRLVSLPPSGENCLS